LPTEVKHVTINAAGEDEATIEYSERMLVDSTLDE
jgi:hypothetical protein